MKSKQRPAVGVQSRQDEPVAEALTVALAQMAPRLGDVEHNLGRHAEILRQARDHGANLVVFPELSLTGYFLKDLVPDVAQGITSPVLQQLQSWTADVDALVGCVLESDDNRFYNAAIYFSHGQVAAIHRKVYLPTYGLFDEARYFASGESFTAYASKRSPSPRAWRMGTLICEDMWHPTSAALLARQGIDAFICPSASPGRGISRGNALGTARSYDAMTRTYAQLFTAYLIYCNRVGYEDGVAFWGGSAVVGPDGRLLGEPASRREEVVYHQLSLSAVRRARIANPLLRDERHDIVDAENERIRSRRPLD